MSKFWKAIFLKFETWLQPSTAFHPQTDGQTERTNQTLKQVLRCTLDKTDDWDTQLPILELAYNTSISTSTGATPYQVVYGREALTPLDLSMKTDLPAATDFLDRFHSLWEATKNNILRAQQSQRASANKKRRPMEFMEGDKVMLSTENIKLAGVDSAKLKPRWIRPFMIKAKKSSTLYQLQLPSTLKIHDTFHISLLKPFIEPAKFDQGYDRPPPIGEKNYSEEYEVEKILAKRQRGLHVEYLLKWKGYPDEENTWTKRQDLNCPELLEEFEREQDC